MALSLRIASHSETGLVRKNNQDSGMPAPSCSRWPTAWGRGSR